MVRIKQKAAKTVKSLLSKRKEPTLKQLEESYEEQEELLLSSEDELELEEENEPNTGKKKNPAARRGIIYLGHIPHGFYENEMKEFFSQFGEVVRIKLHRNQKTGKSQHYAHIEFSNAKVAQIVAKTMDGYLMYGHQLECKVVPKKHRFAIFPPSSKSKPPGYSRFLAYKKYNGVPSNLKKMKQTTLKQLSEAAKKWKEMGIQYDISSLLKKEFGSDVAEINT